MAKVIVADTGPLIALALIEILPALAELFEEIYVPEGVLKEATGDITRPGAQAIKDALEKGWLTARVVKMTEVFQDFIDFLDQGEAEALALAKELNAVALIDERRGRRAAIKKNIAITGSAAVLITAKQKGYISSVKSCLDKLHDHGYRMSDRLVSEVLKRVGE